MPTFREREKRLAALEAKAEAERAAAVAETDNGPDSWAHCTVCGNTSDPRQWHQAESRRFCPWCGGSDFGPIGGSPCHLGLVAATFVCPNCGHEHGAADRQPSPWNSAGACPACGFAPPPPGDDLAQFDAWQAEMLPRAYATAVRRVIALLDDDILYVRAFNPREDLRNAHNQQVKHCCWVRGAESGLALDSPYWQPLEFLQTMLDDECKRIGQPFCQSSAVARAVLTTLLHRYEGDSHANQPYVDRA